MPRRAPGGVRPLDPDPIHQSKLVQQVINKVMIDGKKSTAEKIVYDALEQLARRTQKEPVDALDQPIRALPPALEVRSRRVGGATTRFRWKSPSAGLAPSQSAGSSPSRAHVARRRCPSGSPASSWTRSPNRAV